MESCEVLIVGGGPAGSTCAGKLRKGGLDVLLMDRETFPRDKPCAGWITPAVMDALEIDAVEYCRGRVLQPISGFSTGLIGGPGVVTRYGRTVSYGIRRCEFDHYLLERSGVRRTVGEPVSVLERSQGGWLVNGRIRAALVVGAGGHFCPVARLLGAKIGREEVICAQVAEIAMDSEDERLSTVAADTPALFFCRDMKGYGWLFRKGAFLNIGLGRMGQSRLGCHTRAFRAFLEGRGALPNGADPGFRGHAYLAYEREGGRRMVADGALLIGDAAGLAFPLSGEGILPAIESALLAADTILAAAGDYRQDSLKPYGEAISARFGGTGLPSSAPLSAILRHVGGWLLKSPMFARRVVLDRWFLHG